MVNRSDRRFATLSPAMAHEAARLIGNEARGNPSRPGLHLEPNEQAGYMTATEFQIASAITLARGRGQYMAGGEEWIRTFGSACWRETVEAWRSGSRPVFSFSTNFETPPRPLFRSKLRFRAIFPGQEWTAASRALRGPK